jgi:sortase (surface protein transpeptidase)
VYLTIGKKMYTYRVTDLDIRLPTDPLLYASTSNDQTLSLVACHPPYSVKYRIVAHAVLIDIDEY